MVEDYVKCHVRGLWMWVMDEGHGCGHGLGVGRGHLVMRYTIKIRNIKKDMFELKVRILYMH